MARSALLVLLAALVLGGCLPSSCQREAPRELFPADSLSRSIAEATPADTLALGWQSSGTEAHPLEFPRTAMFGPEGTLYISDARRNSLFAFDGMAGTLQHAYTDDRFTFPYISGVRGDTVLVFNPDAHHIDFVVEGQPVRQVPTPSGDQIPRRDGLLFTAADSARLYFKAVGEGFDGYVARLSDDGTIEARAALPQAYWRHAGFLRVWDERLLSLSYYRPVADVLPTDWRDGAAVDTLAFTGFDSPMLARSRAFMQGDISQPPFLTASAVPVGDKLFVLNLRIGWLQVDVFDRAGQLQHRLLQPRPTIDREFRPVDLAVHREADGAYRLAIVQTNPEPLVRTFRWVPDEAAPQVTEAAP